MNLLSNEQVLERSDKAAFRPRFPRPNKKLLLLTGDAIAVLAAFTMAYFFRVGIYEDKPLFMIGERLSLVLLVGVLVHLLVFFVLDLYSVNGKNGTQSEMVAIGLGVFSATFFIIFFLYLFPSFQMGRVVMAVHAVCAFGAMCLWRKLFARLLLFRSRLKKNLVWLHLQDGTASMMAKVADAMAVDYHGVGVVTGWQGALDGPTLNGDLTYPNLAALIRDNDVQTLVLPSLPDDASGLKNQLIDLKYAGLEVYDFPTFYQKVCSRIPVMNVQGSYMLFAHQDKTLQPYIYLKLKRVLDIVLSGVGLLLTSPVLLAVAVAIKRDSIGPVLFRQERLGYNERPFTLIKFRTMVDDAEKQCGPRWSSADDPRVTLVGRLLRKTRLDELPQLVNVLKGEMSFVGPRPIRKYFADLLADQFPFYRLRFMVKPGLTGWAQVNGDYAGSVDGQRNKLEYDLYYIQRRSILLDLYIFLKTVQTVLFQKGE